MNTNNAAMIAPPKTTANTLTPMATGLDRPLVLPLLLLAAAVEDDDVTGRTAEPVDPDDPVPVLSVCVALLEESPTCVALLEETPTLVGVVLTLFDLLEVALALLEGDAGVVEADACSDVDEPALNVVDDIDTGSSVVRTGGPPPAPVVTSLARTTLRLFKLI
jgi:hypothetical protein